MTTTRLHGDQPQPTSPTFVSHTLAAVAKMMLNDSDVRATTTDRFAKLAGVAIGTIYSHFTDIDDLLAVSIADLLKGESPESGKALAKEAALIRARILDHLIRERALTQRGVVQRPVCIQSNNDRLLPCASVTAPGRSRQHVNVYCQHQSEGPPVNDAVAVSGRR